MGSGRVVSCRGLPPQHQDAGEPSCPEEAPAPRRSSVPAGAGGLLPGCGVDRRRRRSGEGERPVLAGRTRSRRWLRLAPPGYIGRRCGRSSHKRQLSKRRALIGPAPLTHRPRRTVQHFFFFFNPPLPSFCKKKESDGLGESESEIEEDEGESFGVGRAGVLGRPTGRGCEPQAAAPPSSCPGSGPAWPGPHPTCLCLCGTPRVVSAPVGRGRHRCPGSWSLWVHA